MTTRSVGDRTAAAIRYAQGKVARHWRPWLTLRAVDSSFYEIETADAAALAKIRGTDFRGD